MIFSLVYSRARRRARAACIRSSAGELKSGGCPSPVGEYLSGHTTPMIPGGSNPARANCRTPYRFDHIGAAALNAPNRVRALAVGYVSLMTVDGAPDFVGALLQEPRGNAGWSRRGSRGRPLPPFLSSCRVRSVAIDGEVMTRPGRLPIIHRRCTGKSETMSDREHLRVC